MYGIIIEGVRFMIEDHYGSATLALVLERAHVANLTFSTHDRYSEKIIPNLLLALSDITGNSVEEVGVLAGRYFVRFMMKYGHAELLKVLGRRFADFLKGLDSLHEYFRFSYPRIRPPSFYCDRETTDGLTLHYRSRRQGYISYVMGQLIEIAKVFFDQDITVELVRKEEKKGFQYVLLRVTFDNKDYNTDQTLRDKNIALNEFLPVDSLSVLNMFPYFIAFNKRMEIVVVGKALSHIIPELMGKRIDEEFDLLRPCVKFTWDACQHHLNNLFELETMYPVQKKFSNASIAFAVNDQVEDKVKLPGSKLPDQQALVINGKVAIYDHVNGMKENDNVGNSAGNYLHLKGPMVYLKHSEINIYLPTVLIETLDDLFDLGLYLNDYSASDCNREIIMASVQKSDDLKELLKKEKEKSRTLAKNMRDIDQARKTAKELLSQMMPRELANELIQSGKRSVTLCEAFDEVTIAFAKIVDFNLITGDMPPMSVVSLLNTLFSLFDDVVSKHGVYKVETVGESYMVSCGVPYPTQNHTEYIADTCLDMVRAVESVRATIVDGKSVCLKVGVHSGSVVGGIVGTRAPRYCLFGDTVNCASRLESHNKQPMTIQVSVKTKVLLENFAPGQFHFENRGKVNLKGKGEMLAFGLLSKKGVARSEKHPLANTAGVMIDDDDADAQSVVYTPMDDFDDNSRGSTMSRMSISMAATGSKGYRSSATSSSSQGIALSRLDEDGLEQAVKKKRDALEDGGLISGNVNDQGMDGAKKDKRRAKDMTKERKRKEKVDHFKQRDLHGSLEEKEGMDSHQTPLSSVSKPEPETGGMVVRGAETLGASTSNKSFLSVHVQPLQASLGFEKPPAPEPAKTREGQEVKEDVVASRRVIGSDGQKEHKPKQASKPVVPYAEPVKVAKTKDQMQLVKAAKAETAMPAIGHKAGTNTTKMNDAANGGTIERRSTKQPAGEVPKIAAASTKTGAISTAKNDKINNVMPNTIQKGPRVTADKIKAEARSIVADQLKAMDDLMKTTVKEKTPLPPISNASLEEMAKLSTNNKLSALAVNKMVTEIDDDDGKNGYVLAVADENVPAECICGRYKEVQVLKTKACSLM